MEKKLKQQIEEDEALDYHMKEWELFKEQAFLKEYEDKGDEEHEQQ